MAPANIINHIVLVLDASSSMQGRVAQQLVKVADNQIAHLANRSQELNQETRITVYSFAASGFTGHRFKKDLTKCLVWDMDVLRVPSIADIYECNGSTPLIDASLLALNDLALVTEKYGEHSFLIYVLTDGAENASTANAYDLATHIKSLPDNWTVAAFVPDASGLSEAKRFGFPAENIAIWSTTAEGVSEVGVKIRETTENFMQGRAVGVRGSKNLFVALEKPSLAKVAKEIKPLPNGAAVLYDIYRDSRIDDFINRTSDGPYRRGMAYYQLTKREEVQPQKAIAILGKDGKVYVGDAARDLLGLPNQHVKVSPNHSSDYDIFIQSTSDNRKLLSGTKLLVIP